MRTRVKICGITNIEDALAAVDEGADALGFVFYKPSPRYIDIQKAKDIIDKIPPFISKVALFVNADNDFVVSVIQQLSIDLLQFHGDESEAFCQSFSQPYMKAIRVQEETDMDLMAKQYHSSSGLLLDAFDSSQYGGTGHSFDWALMPKNFPLPIILAGGLKVTNIAKAIKTTQPYAVDVSSGVEKSKGLKDHLLIQQFMHEVKCAND